MRKANFDTAYAYVRDRILSGEFRSGQALLPEPLSVKIGVSRTTVRDALRILATEGLVTFEGRIGASVRHMEIGEFREMCEVRLALEGHAAGLAALHRTEGELRAIHAPLVAMRDLINRLAEFDQDETRLMHNLAWEDVRFHLAISTAAKNELIKREILRLQFINRVVTGPLLTNPPGGDRTKAKLEERRQLVLAEHHEIYVAIKDQSGPGARDAMERHLQGVIENRLFSMGQAMADAYAAPLGEEEPSYLA